MDSDSSDSDNVQNNHNHQFNAEQTEAVVKCVFEVLKLIINVSKKNTKSKKEVMKPIRKEKKAKLKMSEVADVQTHIRALCGTFNSIASSSSCPQVEVPGPSRHSEAVPGTSRHSVAVPGPSKHSTAIPETFRHSEAMPGPSSNSVAVPGPSKVSEIIPGTSRHSDAVPVSSRYSEAIPANARPDIETVPVSLSHGTERVVPENCSFKKHSEDIKKRRTDTRESLQNHTSVSETFEAGPGTATSSTIDDNATSGNCTTATSGNSKTHLEAGLGSSRTHSEKNIPVSSENQTERSEFSTSNSDVAEPRTPIKTVPDISGSSTQTMSGTSKNPSTKTLESSSNNHENVAETSKIATEARNIVVTSGIILESLKQKMETEVSGTPAILSDVSKSGTSRHTEVIAPDILGSSTKTMPGTSKSPTEKGPAISKKYRHKVVTEISPRFNEPVEETSKRRPDITNPVISRNDTEFMVSGTTGSRTAEPETAASRTKDHHGTIESRTKAVSENSAFHRIVGPATKTVIPETFSYYAKTMSGTFRNNSNTELHRVSNSKAVTESSESNNITVEYNSLNRYDEIPPIEGNLQICTKIKVATTESVEINNNIAATKRDMEKRKSTNSIDDEPKRARIDDKCTLCGKSISNEEFTKHYQKQHGMHHEIQHNNRNFENKIQDLDRRLHDTHKNNTNNEQKKKITDDSKKRTTARSSSVPNEDTKQIVANSTLVIVMDSDVAKKLECKKKRTSTRSDSAPIGLIEQTSSSPTLKRETNHITDLDSFVIDLTEDNNIGESKPCTDITVTKCSPKTADDDQILNDSQFIYPSDDTSLYEIPDEKETKIAEALLLENVKDEKAANNHFDSDIEVICDVIPALSNSNKPSGTENHTTANQSSDQMAEGIDQRDSLKIQNDSEEIVSESSERGIRVVPRSPISNTKIKDETFGNLSDLGTASHSQASKPKTFSNITTVMSSRNPLIRTEAASERAVNCIRYNLGNSGTIIKKLVHSGNNSKNVPAISLKHAQNKQKVEQRDSEKQINKPTRQTPYEKPNKTSSYTDKITNGPTATNATNAPKVSMLNATTTITTQPIQKANRLHFAENNSSKPNNHKLNINNASTGTVLTRLTTEVSVSSPNSTNVTSKVLNEAAIQPNSTRQLTSNTNNNANKLKTTFPGLSITVSESKDSVPSSSISISLPHSTTITPIPVTQIASQSSVGKHNTNASTDVAQLSTSLRPMPNTQVSPNITTSLLVHSALKQQSLPHKLPIFYKPKLNAVTQSISKRASNSASVLLPIRHSNTKPREQLPTQENPANVQNAQIQQPGLPVIKSTHRGPVSPISHSRDFSRNTENILPSNTNPTPSTSRSTPKQHPSTPVQANTSVFQNTPATAAPGYFTQSYYRKKSNTAVNVQSPQTRWYSPFLVDAHRVDASTRELNTFSSNIASRNRNANRSSTAVNTHIAHPQTHSWHTPVEPQNAQSVAERTLSNSNRSIINQRPTNSQRINTTHSSSNSRRPYLFPRQPSRLLDQRPRPIQNGLTWHTPVREPRTNN